MHEHILTDQQLQMLSVIKNFSDRFYLVGGTALALQLGHRRSLDFDLFSNESFDHQLIRNIFTNNGYPSEQILIETEGEFTFISNGVKFTFYHFLYQIDHQIRLKNTISMPDQSTIGAMKAFALGKRAKWKDYVDLYFIFQKHSLKDITSQAIAIFGGGEFSEKLFREQLAYHEDINYSEQVEFLPGFETPDNVIKSFLSEISLQA